MEAIYGAYALDWLETRDDLGIEALFLADVLSTQLPNNVEALALAALLGFAAARRGARISDGMFVPLDEQDPRKWNQPLVRGAQALLQRASALEKMGRFQLEAAIQAVHARRIDGHDMHWCGITQLYAGLCQLYPSLGAQIGYAAALTHVHGSDAGFPVLDALDLKLVADHQSYHAARAHFLATKGHLNAAVSAFDTALASAPEPALRAFLGARHLAFVTRL